MESLLKYLAFISYRHADNREEGRKWATWLHQAIEAYEVPADIVGTTNDRGEEIPAQIFPVFRDEEELPADADLGNAITKALDASGLLVVLCSPQAVASTYVAEEIDYYKTLGRSERIIAALIDGEPNCSWDASKLDLGFSKTDECFPLPLQFEYGEDGKPSEKRAEPIAADFRVNINGTLHQGWTNTEALRQHLQTKEGQGKEEITKIVEDYSQQLHLMLLKVIAGILGVPLGLLTQRDKEFQLAQARRKAKILRRWLMAVGVLAIVAAGAGVLAYLNQQEAIKNEKIANEQTIIAKSNEQLANERRDAALVTQSRFLMDQARQENEDGQYDTALLLGLNAVPGPYGGDRPSIPFIDELRHAVLNSDKYMEITRPNISGDFYSSPDGKMIAIPERNGPSSLWGIETGEKIADYSPQSNLSVEKTIFSKDGKILASIKGQNIHLWSVDNKEPLHTLSPKTDEFLMIRDIAFSPDGSKIVALKGNKAFFVYSTIDGKQTHKFNKDGVNGFEGYVAFNPKGDKIISVVGNNDVYVWSLTTSKLELIAKSAENNKISRNRTRMPFFGDKGQVFTFDSEGVHTWDLKTGAKQTIIKDNHVFASRDGKKIIYLVALTTTNFNTPDQIEKAKKPVLYSVDTNSYVELSSFNPINNIIFSPVGQNFLTIDSIGYWILWSGEGNKIKTIKGDFSNKTRFSKDGKYIISTNRSDNLVTIWKAKPEWDSVSFANLKGLGVNHFVSPKAGSLVYRLVRKVDNDPKNNKHELNFWSLKDGHLIKKQELNCNNPALKLPNLGDYLLSKCFKDPSWTLYSMHTGEIIHKDFPFGRDPIFSPNGEIVAGYTGMESLAIWSLTEGKTIKQFQGRHTFFRMEFSWDGLYFITGDLEGKITRWALKGMSLGETEIRLDDPDPLYSVDGRPDILKISPDGETIAVYIKGGDIILLSASSGEVLKQIPTNDELSAIHFDPKSKFIFLVTNKDDGKLTIWPIVGDKEPMTIQNVNSFGKINFHPNGDLFSYDGTNNFIWSLKTGTRYLGFHFKHNISTLGFSHDGKSIIAITQDGLIQKWPILEGDLTEVAISKLPINKICLTPEEREKFYLPPLTDTEKMARSCSTE